MAPGFCAAAHSRFGVVNLRFLPMAARYYTHFVTSAEPAHSSEWSGVIELTHPLGERRDSKELRRLLAANFEIDAEDIKILQVARLH
jgi:hypothetical protein